MSDTKIRDYQDQDFSKVSSMLVEYQSLIGDLSSTFGKRAFETKSNADDYLRQCLKDVRDMNGYFYVAELEGVLVGFIYGVVLNNEDNLFHKLTHIPGKEGWIGIVYVLDKYRQHGVGSELVKHARDFMKKAGCSSMRLVVDSTNQKAVSYYSKLGFEEYEKKLTIKI